MRRVVFRWAGHGGLLLSSVPQHAVVALIEPGIERLLVPRDPELLELLPDHHGDARNVGDAVGLASGLVLIEAAGLALVGLDDGLEVLRLDDERQAGFAVDLDRRAAAGDFVVVVVEVLGHSGNPL